MRRRLSAVVAVALLIAGCTAKNAGLLRWQVSHTIRPGMTMAAAEQALHGVEFTCDPANYKPLPPEIRTCQREKSDPLTSLCVQTVRLMPDPSRVILARYKIQPIVCAGI